MMKNHISIFTILLCFIFVFSTNASGKTAVNLRCEYTINPSSIDVASPRLSWAMQSDERNDYQTSYRIIVASSRDLIDKSIGDMWDSKKINSDNTVQIQYAGKPLASSMHYYWKVMLWDAKNKQAEWSDVNEWSMGLLERKDWAGAQWITFKDDQVWKKEWTIQKQSELANAPDAAHIGSAWPWFTGKDSTIFALYKMSENKYDAAPLFRKDFSVNKSVKNATLYICGLGYYVAYINGTRVGDRVLNPAWTNYDKRVLYDTYDVTKMLSNGENVIGAMLGRGQYNPLCNDIWGLSKSSWIAQPKLIAFLNIEYEDGHTDKIITNNSWKTDSGPVIYDDTRHGELYDARLEQAGWNTPKFDDSAWKQANTAVWNATLQSQAIPPIREFSPIKPVNTMSQGENIKLYDIGKNIAGWAKVTVKGKRGDKVLVEYSERPAVKEFVPNLTPSCFDYNIPDKFYASFYDKHVNVRQQNGYILKGDGEETFKCMFSYKGFQYIRVSTDKDVEVVAVEGIPVHSDLEKVGDFSCSDDVVNKIQNCAVNSMLNNYFSIPTDCPHREKQGWTADAFMSSNAAMYNFNMATFFSKWITDLAETQAPNGGLCTVAPSTGYDGNSSTTWPAAIVYVPYNMFCFYNDKQILKTNLKTMERFAESSKQREVAGKEEIINDVLGDWVSPHKTLNDNAPRNNDMAPPEGTIFYGSASHFLVHKRLAEINNILGANDKASFYKKRSEKIENCFNKEFFNKNNDSYHGTNPTGYRQSTNLVALQYGLVEEGDNQSVLKKLIKNIEENNSHLSTGFLGTQALIEYLPEIAPELTYKIVTQPEYPSWGYMIAQGATSMWESWDGYDSRNHLPFCMVSEYFYKNLAGIQLDKNMPGFKHIIIKPSFIKDLTYVNGCYKTLVGTIECDWKRNDKKLFIDITIPANTYATIYLPASSINNISESGKPVKQLKNGIKSIKTDNNYILIEIGSGKYMFSVDHVL